MTDRTRGSIEMTIAMIILGTIGWVVVVSEQPVADLVFWRCAFGAGALLVVCGARGLLRGALNRRVITLAALGGVAIVLNWVLLFAAFPRASISIATAVYSTQPFILVALGMLFLREPITKATLGWLTLAFVGTLVIIQSKADASYTGSAYGLGILMAFGAAFFYAVTVILTKKLDGTPPHLIAFIQVCVGTLMLAPFANLSHPPADAATWGALAALGIVYTGLMFTLQYSAVQKLPTHLAGALYFLYPVVAFVVDAVALDHRLQPMQFIGAAAILLAAAGLTLQPATVRGQRSQRPGDPPGRRL